MAGSGIRALASALDPLLTSGTMFLVQGAVLLSTSRAEFASYSLAFSYVGMGQAVLSALFGGPLVTLLGGMDGDEARAEAGEAALRLQLGIALLVAVCGFVGALSLALPPLVSGVGALGLVGLSFRDALRNVLAAQLQMGRALVVAVWFGGSTALALAVILLTVGRVSALLGLAALAIGALATLAMPIARAVSSRARLQHDALRQLVGMAAWSLPGAAVIWLQNSFYLTLVALNLSLDAVGEVSAARMTVMPILITASGLLRLAQVQASREILEGARHRAIQRARRVALVCLALGAVAAGVCWSADRFMDHRQLPPAYPHLLVLAGTWIIFAAATTARGLYSSLYQAMGRYREIFIYNAAILPFVLSGIAVAPGWLGLAGAVLPMAAGEIALLAVLAAAAGRCHA